MTEKKFHQLLRRLDQRSGIPSWQTKSVTRS